MLNTQQEKQICAIAEGAVIAPAVALFAAVVLMAAGGCAVQTVRAELDTECDLPEAVQEKRNGAPVQRVHPVQD